MNNSSCDPNAHPLRWLVLALVCVGTFMATLDISIVSIALPRLTELFHTTPSTTQWVVLSYTFVITILLLTFGKLGDLIGRRRIYTYGIIIFVIGSLLCGFSTSILMLILARALQGIGSSMTMSAGPAFVTEGFPARERGKALGFVGTAVALGLLTGPMIGGILVEYTSWRWIFFLNVPIGLVLAILLTTRVHGFDMNMDGKLDTRGAVLMAITIAALLFGLTFGNRLGWTSPATISIFLSAVILAAVFVRVEKQIENPVLNLELFRNRGFMVAAVAGWANYAAIIPVSVFMPFYLENLLKYSPGKVGLILAFGPITLAIFAPVAGSLSDKIGYRLLTSVGLFIAGLAVFSMRMLTPTSTWIDVAWRLVLASFGSALFVSPNSSSIMGSVKCEDMGIASGTIALVRNLGMVCGVALAGAIIATVSRNTHIAATRDIAFFQGLKAAFIACAAISFFGSLTSSLRTSITPTAK